MVTGPRLRLGSVACVKVEKEEELNPLCGGSAGTGRVGQQDLVVRGLCVRGVDGIASKGLGGRSHSRGGRTAAARPDAVDRTIIRNPTASLLERIPAVCRRYVPCQPRPSFWPSPLPVTPAQLRVGFQGTFPRKRRAKKKSSRSRSAHPHNAPQFESAFFAKVDFASFCWIISPGKDLLRRAERA